VADKTAGNTTDAAPEQAADTSGTAEAQPRREQPAADRAKAAPAGKAGAASKAGTASAKGGIDDRTRTDVGRAPMIGEWTRAHAGG